MAWPVRALPVRALAGEKWKAILFATMAQITVGVAKDLVKLGACVHTTCQVSYHFMLGACMHATC